MRVKHSLSKEKTRNHKQLFDFYFKLFDESSSMIKINISTGLNWIKHTYVFTIMSTNIQISISTYLQMYLK